MKFFPFTTYFARRRTAEQCEASLEAMMRSLTAMNQHRFLCSDIASRAKRLRERVPAVRNYVARKLRELNDGKLEPFDCSKTEAILVACKALVAEDNHFRSEVDASHNLLNETLEDTVALAYDEARNMHRYLINIREELTYLRKKGRTEQEFRRWMREVRGVADKVTVLRALVRDSAEARNRLGRAAQLPLRETEENCRKLESLKKSAALVEAARAAGQARKLRESWTEELHIFSELQRESELWVRRALRELDCWLSQPELHPELSLKWSSRLQQLRERHTTATFLADWSAVKKELGKHVEKGFTDIGPKSRRAAVVFRSCRN